MKRRRKGFNRWFGLVMAFLAAPLLTLVAAGGFVNGSLRTGPYDSEPPDLRHAVVTSSHYNNSHRSTSTCTVILMTDLGPLTAEVADDSCFREIAAGDHVTFRFWRGDVTTISDGQNSLWTNRNPGEQVHQWLPIFLFCGLGTVALMVWSVWKFIRNRPPPRQSSPPD